MNTYRNRVNKCRNLESLRDTLNAIEDELYREYERTGEHRKIEELVNISDLPVFGREPTNTEGFFSYDNTRILVSTDRGWKIEERDEPAQPTKIIRIRNIPVDIHTALKKRAIDEGMSMEGLVLQWITAMLEKAEKQEGKK